MDPNRVVLDISSDEETDVDAGTSFVDFEWISKLLDQDDKDYSDEVMVVGEVVAKPNSKLASVPKSSTIDDDADDCVILDDDPDKSLSFVNDAACQSDELLVVGEKGQIACRDYPHPRHLCAKFPFRVTLHERHCDQCHCYVCDSLAPCVHWGTGTSILDHCHATDKEETWKVMRKNVKLVVNGSPPVPKTIHTSLYSMNRARQPYHSLPRNHRVARSTLLRPCSSISVPNTIGQIRNPRAGIIRPTTRFRIGPPNVLGVRNNAVRKDKFHKNIGYVANRHVPTHSFPSNQSNDPVYKYPINFYPSPVPIDKTIIPWKDSISRVNSQMGISGLIENSIPSPPAGNSFPTSQPNDTQNCHTDSIFQDIGTSMIDNITMQSSYKQPEGQNGQFQNVEPVKDSLAVPELISQIPGSCGANPTSLYFDFEEWLLEPSVSQSAAPLPSDLNTLPPESVPIDTGLLYFDFETSLNGLMG